MPKLTITQVTEAPSYYVDHLSGKLDTDKSVMLRDASIVTDTSLLRQSLEKLPKNTNILDMTNNDLVLLPPLNENHTILTLLLARNRIGIVDGSSLPRNVKNLSLAKNEISSFEQLAGLKDAPKTLVNLCLRGNDVCYLKGYREFVVSLCPHLQILDFEKVKRTKEEKEDVQTALEEKIISAKSPGKRRDKHLELLQTVVGKMDENTKKEIKEQLANATTLDEVERLEKLLSGNID